MSSQPLRFVSSSGATLNSFCCEFTNDWFSTFKILFIYVLNFCMYMVCVSTKVDARSLSLTLFIETCPLT